MIIKLKLGVSGCFFDEKKANYCKIQVSSLRRFAFAPLRWPHCVRPPTPLRQPGSATRLITVLAPLPAHSGAQITWPLQWVQSFIATFLDLRVNGFGRFCTLRHRYPPDGPPSLNVNLTLKSQEYDPSCLYHMLTLLLITAIVQNVGEQTFRAMKASQGSQELLTSFPHIQCLFFPHWQSVKI